MAFVELREKAQMLRAKGKSIAQICQTLNASKSTVSYWCRDIKLSGRQMRALIKRQHDGGSIGRLRASEAKRAARLLATQVEYGRGSKDVGILSQRDRFILGIALYWGEGYKSGNDECGLTNSNPHIIRAFITWLQTVYDVHVRDLILRVSVNGSHAYRVREIEKYWSKETTIPLSQFTKTSLIKVRMKKIYKNEANHFGTLRVKVRRATALRRRILGSIAEISKQIIQQI